MRRILFDGLNLSLPHNTGIGTYGRILTRVAGDLGYGVEIVYSTPFKPEAEPLLREILVFSEKGAPRTLGTKRTMKRMVQQAMDQARYHSAVTPSPIDFTGTVIDTQFRDTLPRQDRAYVSRNLFRNARAFYSRTRKFATLALDPAPDIFHCTCVFPLRVRNSCNIYTIHDVVPLLPGNTQRRSYRLLKKIATDADHIVTVSEKSKRDIVDLLGIPPDRITNTYQAVAFPQEYLASPEYSVANYLDGAFDLTIYGYLLFFGAVEPKKNIARLIRAYLASGIDSALVLVLSPGWQNDAEMALLRQHAAGPDANRPRGPSIRCLDPVGLWTLVNLVRGARALVFPSLYEGFGLPVLEAMTLGVPVITSRAGALPEIVGDAAVLVDPYDIDDIARAIRTIDSDADLRRELSRRGVHQAAKFSLERYRERVRSLYAAVVGGDAGSPDRVAGAGAGGR